MTGVEPKSEKEESISQTVYSLPKDQYIKTQISRHATQLKLPNSTDIEKTKALQNIIHLLFGFNLSLFHEIVTQSIAIEEVYKLMLRTKNPNIRTLCGALLQVVQQRGTETEKKADWRTLLSPIVSFLFNTDELISELGKQALIDALEKQPESLQALIELDLIEHATEELNLLTDSILNSASQQFSIFDPNKDLPIGILANIMKVVIRMLQKGNINDIKTAELRYVAEQLSHKQLTQQFEAFCKEILLQSQTSQKNMNNNVLQPPEHSIPKMKLLTVAEEAAKHFICELSNTIMTDPVSIDGLHYFERNALVEYIQNQGISHVTYEATTVNDIKEEPALKAELERYLRDNPTRLSKK
ncbi:MAG: hypothetical protein EZS28_016343 [Streblomastix strix]|uniref:U-box domain-containing protein n=1 Tax=Streblomastix strix TaxID=222440 RepID=A0A5J4W0I1_9EUKA|nr:MAG: hypothetical protein EZS28_016343 [Streblomastix strix]